MTQPIEIPSDLQDFAERQASCEGFATASDYVTAVLRRERNRLAEEQLIALLQEGIDFGEPTEFSREWLAAERARIERLLLEGLNSGPPIEVTDEWWE